MISTSRSFLIRLRRLLRVFVDVTVVGYTLALAALLGLRLLGRDHRWWIAFLINFTPYFFLPVFICLLVALLARARFAVIAAAPLAVVGLVLYGPLFLPKPAPVVSGSTFHIITFNISDLNQRPDDVIAWLREKQADVVLLQEVSADWFGPLRQELDDLYPEQIHQLTERGYRGNLTLSRFPLLLVPSVSAESPQFQRVILDLNGQPTTIYNVSLATPVNANPRRELPFEYPFLDLAFVYDDSVRNEQIAQLLAQVEVEPPPYIVAGDFNMSDQTSIYGSISAQMKDSFREAGIGLGANWPAFEAIGIWSLIPPLIRVDYVWHSDDYRAVSSSIGPYLGSDHRPVDTVLEARAGL